MKTLWLVVGLAFGLAGCQGVTVEGVCEELRNCPGGVGGGCRSQGEAIEQASEDLGCGAEFDAYLDCIDQNGCGYEAACVEPLNLLESCAGPLPGA